MVPYYWAYGQVKNEENTRLRIKDALGSVFWEEIGMTDYVEWGW